MMDIAKFVNIDKNDLLSHLFQLGNVTLVTLYFFLQWNPHA